MKKTANRNLKQYIFREKPIAMNTSILLRSAALAAVLFITGCEKKASNPVDLGSSQGNFPTGARISDAQRTVVFTALRRMQDSVAKINPNAVRSATLNFFRSTPEFSSSGVSPDSSLFAVFTDGRILIFSDNRKYDPTAQSQYLSKTTSATTKSFAKVESKLPTSADVYLMDTSTDSTAAGADLSYVMRSTRKLNKDLLNIVTKSGYIPHRLPASLANLRKVKNAGIFHIATHGGMANPSNEGSKIYSFMTSDVVGDKIDTLGLSDDLDSKRVTYFEAENGDDVQHRWFYMNYGITPAFIAKYMKFSENSLIVITACTSHNSEMLSAFATAGASVYIGWDNVVWANISDLVAALLFDRCLGTNLVSPIPNPPQRPFSWQFVLDDIVYRKLNVSRASATVTANLKFTQFGGDLTVLLPTIMTTSFTQYPTELRYNLQGDFTSTPGTVLLDGVALNLTKAWKDGSLETTLPTHGGNIQVSVNGALSNVVQLSEYRGHFTYTDQGSGTLLKKVVADINFLADLHKYRVVSGANQFYKDEAVFNGPRLVAVLSTSHASYEASGSYQTTTWSGSGNINNWSSLVSTNLPQGTFNVYLGDEGGTAMIELVTLANYTVTTGTSSSTQIFGVGDGGTSILNTSVGTGYVIKGNRVTKTSTGHTYTIDWGDITPAYPPSPTAAR
jgi:hypothetical protein